MAISYIKNRLFETHGVTFSIIDGETETAFKCIFSPLRYKNKMYLSGVPTEIGYDSMSKFLILAPIEAQLKTVDGVDKYLSFKGNQYKIDHCEEVYFKGKPFYFWAIIHRED